MPRTRRYTFNTFTVLSLLLLLATVWFWMDSRWYSGLCRFGYDGPASLIEIESGYGHLFLKYDNWTQPEPRLWYAEVEHVRELLFSPSTGDPEYVIDFVVLELWYWKFADSFAIEVGSPDWFLSLLFATLPAIWFLKWRRRRKLGSNACPNCTYDLTGNESGVCPECGAKVQAKGPQASPLSSIGNLSIWRLGCLVTSIVSFVGSFYVYAFYRIKKERLTHWIMGIEPEPFPISVVVLSCVGFICLCLVFCKKDNQGSK